MHDFDAYLRRIGLSGRPTVAELHRAHATTIPFENLDPYRGVPVSLAPEAIEGKLVADRRGGYCFEQNLLLKAALEELGAEVDTLLARARLGAWSGQVRPRTHLVLHVRLDGASWLADVGFGFGTLLEPLPFADGAAGEQSGWAFRLVAEGDALVLQALRDGSWVDQYALDPEPAPFVDLETANWFTATYPRSPFVTGPVVGAHHADGSRTFLRTWSEDGLAVVEQTPQGATTTPVAPAELPRLLATRFALPGFTLRPDGRPVPPAIE